MYSVGVGLLKLNKLSGTSSWMGDCPATVQGLVPVVMLLEGIVYWKWEHYSLPNGGKKQVGKVYILTDKPSPA